jgi:hypothetical protein
VTSQAYFYFFKIRKVYYQNFTIVAYYCGLLLSGITRHNWCQAPIVACWATGYAVRIVNSFYYKLTVRNYNYLLHGYTFTQFTITTRQSFHSISRSLHVFITWESYKSSNSLNTSSLADFTSYQLLSQIIPALAHMRSLQFTLLNCEPTTIFHLRNFSPRTVFANSLLRTDFLKSKSKSHCDWWSVSQSVSQSWCRGPPDIYCCLTVTVLLLWGALSEERTGLSFRTS